MDGFWSGHAEAIDSFIIRSKQGQWLSQAKKVLTYQPELWIVFWSRPVLRNSYAIYGCNRKRSDELGRICSRSSWVCCSWRNRARGQTAYTGSYRISSRRPSRIRRSNSCVTVEERLRWRFGSIEFIRPHDKRSKVGMSVTGYCIRFKTLKDINIEILEAAIRYGFEAQNEKAV